jgi:hypothetical protein
VEELRQQVKRLEAELHGLHETVEDLREDMERLLSPARLTGRFNGPLTGPPLTSMSKDPCAKDFAINRIKPEDLPPLEPKSTPTMQGELF